MKINQSISLETNLHQGLAQADLVHAKTYCKLDAYRYVIICTCFVFGPSVTWSLNYSPWSLRDQVPDPLVPQEKSLNYTLPFPTRGQNTLDLIITSLPRQLVDIRFTDRLSDHDIVSGTLKKIIPPPTLPSRNLSIYLLILSRSISDHHLRCGVGG